MNRPVGHVLRRVTGEPALILGAPRALLMQVAHPKIAVAVAALRRGPSRIRTWDLTGYEPAALTAELRARGGEATTRGTTASQSDK